MSVLDRARRALDRGARALERIGMSPIRVGVFVETSTEAFGVAGGINASMVRWITPTPFVRKLDVVEASDMGFSVGPINNISAVRSVYELRIPRSYVACCDSEPLKLGTKVSDLFPLDTTPQSRTAIVLADRTDDGELGTRGVPFAIERLTPDELEIVLYVVQAQPQTDTSTG